MVFVGIDISKYKHDCFIATEAGEVLESGMTFDNDQSGFDLFRIKLQSLGPPTDMRIGLESTGHYGETLKSFLITHGYSFMEVHPLLTKKFSQANSLRKTKTDRVDARLICQYLMSVDYKTYHLESYHIRALKSLTRLRAKLMTDRTRHVNMMTTALDVLFPEYTAFFNNRCRKTAYFILKTFHSPSKIARMTEKHYEMIRRFSKGKFTYSNFLKLKDLARNTVGLTDSYILDHIKINQTMIDRITDSVDLVEHSIKELMNTYPMRIMSIKGIGPIYGAIIASEYGDIASFSSPSKMLSFAGLEPSVTQSGTSDVKSGRMVKRGSKHLRYALLRASFTVIGYSPKFYAYYHKKRLEGKSHSVALVHVAKKLIRIIFVLETRQIDFDESLLV